jgi:hypothetical protein
VACGSSTLLFYLILALGRCFRLFVCVHTSHGLVCLTLTHVHTHTRVPYVCVCGGGGGRGVGAPYCVTDAAVGDGQRVVGRAQGKDRFKPLFVQLVLENLWAVYDAAVLHPYGPAHPPAPHPQSV